MEQNHGVDLGKTHENDKQCKNVISAIANEMANTLSETLKKVRFISVMADGATDVGTREALDNMSEC